MRPMLSSIHRCTRISASSIKSSRQYVKPSYIDLSCSQHHFAASYATLSSNSLQSYFPSRVNLHDNASRNNWIRSNSRYMSSSSNKNEDEKDETNKNEDEADAISRNNEKLEKRIKGITMNPKGFSHKILPDYVIEKTNKKTGEVSLVNVDRALGYFWMMKDLNESQSKPILSNETLIPSEDSQLFPSLKGCTTLSDEIVDLPYFCTRNNRSKDANAQCTLVTVSYKDFGHKLLPSWTEQFKSNFASSSRHEVVHISIVEGFFFRLLRRPITSSQKQGTPSNQWDTTLTYFDEDKEELADFRDALRMHNTLTGYVYLLDGVGRVRFAGSGAASEEDVSKLLEFAKELTPDPTKRGGTSGSVGSSGGGGRVGRKIRRN